MFTDYRPAAQKMGSASVVGQKGNKDIIKKKEKKKKKPTDPQVAALLWSLMTT